MGTVVALLAFVICWCYPAWKVLTSKKTPILKKLPWLAGFVVCLITPALITSVGSDGLIHDVNKFFIETVVSLIVVLLIPSIIRLLYEKVNS